MNKSSSSAPASPSGHQTALLNSGWTSVKITAGGGKSSNGSNNSLQTSGRSIQAWLCPSAGSCTRHGLSSMFQVACGEDLSASGKDKGSAKSSPGPDNEDKPEIIDILNDPNNFQTSHGAGGNRVDGTHAKNGEREQGQRSQAWVSPAALEEEEVNPNSKRSDDIANTGYTSTTADSNGTTGLKSTGREKLPIVSGVLHSEACEFWMCLHEVSAKPYLLTDYVSMTNVCIMRPNEKGALSFSSNYITCFASPLWPMQHREPAHISLVLRFGSSFQLLPLYLVSRKVHWKRLNGKYIRY